MNGHTIPLGRVLGIPIDLDYSWFLIFVLLTWMLAVNYYAVEFRGGKTTRYWLMGALTAALVFVSVLAHELAHSIVALRYKIPVHRSETEAPAGRLFGGQSMADGSGKPPAAITIFGTAEASTGYTLRDFISRGDVPFEWVESKSDEQGGSSWLRVEYSVLRLGT